MKKYNISKYAILKTRICLLLFGILLGMAQLEAQPVCYDYNGSGNRVVRKDCNPTITCNCPTGTVTKYYVGEEDETTLLSATEMYLFNSSPNPNPAEPGTGSISGGCITVAGKLVIDANFSFSGVTMMMQPGAEIVITNPAVTLSLYGSTLKSCDKLWRGINVGQSCTFNTWNSTIQDAYYGVKLAHLTKGTISGTIFNKNYIGIFVDGSGSGSNISSDVVIVGNTFDCDAALLKKWDNSYAPSYIGKAGIEANKASFIIGADPFTSPYSFRNTFKKTLCGILMTDSNVNIYNVDILNMSQMAYNSFNVLPNLTRNDAEKLGIGAWASSVNIFNSIISGVNRGIHLENILSFTMENTKINSSLGGVLLNGIQPASTNVPSPSIGISGNCEIQAPLAVLRLKNVKYAFVKIEGNKFYGQFKENIGAYQNDQGYVIDINNMVNQEDNIKNKLIKNNQINYNTDFHGIGILNNNAYSLHENKLTFIFSSATLKNTSAQGILLSQSKNNRIIGNTIDMGYNPPANTLSTYSNNAILGNNATDNNYCCNITNDTKNGFYYLGTNANTKMKNNEMKKHIEYGLFISQGSSIGSQINHWNKWTDTYSATGRKPAKNNNTGTVLTDSKFEVSAALGSSFYPNHIDPVTGWFEGKTPVGEVTCNPTGDCSPAVILDGTSVVLRTQATSYITNQYATAPYGTYSTWSGQRWVLEQIPNNPEWLSDATINTFKVNNQNSNIKKINDLDVQLAQLEKPNAVQQTSLDVIYSTMGTNSTRLAQLGKLLADKPNQVDSLKYWTERSDLLIDQAGMMTRLDNIQREIRNARGAKLDQALALNASITAENDFERNEKAINMIYLNTIARGDSMSIADKATVTRITSLCPMVGGTAVFKARFLYGYYAIPSFDDTKLCAIPSEGGSPINGKVASNNGTTDVLMYPNPATDMVYFSTTSNEPVKLVLVDITGRMLIEQEFVNATQISIANLPNGQYFCQIWKCNQKMDTQKLSVLH